MTRSRRWTLGDRWIIWNVESDPDGNVHHIAEHGVTMEEVEEVLCEPSNLTVPSRSTGYPMTFGWTTSGKHLAVVWEHVADDPTTIYPITAFETKPRSKP